MYMFDAQRSSILRSNLGEIHTLLLKIWVLAMNQSVTMVQYLTKWEPSLFETLIFKIGTLGFKASIRKNNGGLIVKSNLYSENDSSSEIKLTKKYREQRADQA